MAVKIKCPACRSKFKYDITEGWPDFCPLCGTDINNWRADDDIVCPAFLSQKSKNNDQLVRDMMDGSEKRAEIAAMQAGCSVEEMSSLKITDITDRRDAEISAIPVNNEITRHMDSMRAAGMPVGFGGGGSADNSVQVAMGQAAMAHTGELPYAGMRQRNNLQRLMPPITQVPLPRQITDNPNYRSPV